MHKHHEGMEWDFEIAAVALLPRNDSFGGAPLSVLSRHCERSEAIPMSRRSDHHHFAEQPLQRFATLPEAGGHLQGFRYRRSQLNHPLVKKRLINHQY